MSYPRRRWAYYNRNDSYSKSSRAEEAERNGRFPATRAAKKLGLSLKAFTVARHAIGHYASEWHHVGRYATPVNYFDTVALAKNPAFWRAAAEVYRSKTKKLELQSLALAVEMEVFEDAISLFNLPIEGAYSI